MPGEQKDSPSKNRGTLSERSTFIHGRAVFHLHPPSFVTDTLVHERAAFCQHPPSANFTDSVTKEAKQEITHSDLRISLRHRLLAPSHHQTELGERFSLRTSKTETEIVGAASEPLVQRKSRPPFGSPR